MGKFGDFLSENKGYREKGDEGYWEKEKSKNDVIKEM